MTPFVRYVCDHGHSAHLLPKLAAAVCPASGCAPDTAASSVLVLRIELLSRLFRITAAAERPYATHPWRDIVVQFSIQWQRHR
jgi:hypothetical protein